MQKIVPFLWFDRNAEEAANFYVSVFKNARINGVSRYSEAVAQATQMTAGEVLTVSFSLEGQDYVALNGGPVFTFSEAVSLCVACKSQEEIDYYWERLTADGGEESVCGWLKDKFGFSWQITPQLLLDLHQNADPRVDRAMGAVMTMKKIILADIEAAIA